VRLLDRYLLRELLVPLGYCLGGFLVFYIAFDLIFQINRFLDAHLLFWDIVEYYVVTLPELLVEQVLPVSLLLALLYATTNHSRYNELTAMRAAGVSLWRLAVPYFGVGVVFGAAVFLISEFWLPSADDSARLIMERRQPVQSKRGIATKLDFPNEATHREWNMGQFNLRTSEIQNLDLASKMPDGSDRRWQAQRAEYRDGQWILHNALIWNRPPGVSVATLSGSNAVVSLDLAETPEWIRSEIKFNSLRTADFAKGPVFSMREIANYLRLHPQIDAARKARLLTQWQKQLAIPFTCLAVVLIALPFGTRAGRHNVFVGVASSIFICFGYFILQRISFALGVGGSWPPLIAAWLPNIVCGGTGLFLLARAR
jgi:lipopolysaccharide export system permease protein